MSDPMFSRYFTGSRLAVIPVISTRPTDIICVARHVFSVHRARARRERNFNFGRAFIEFIVTRACVRTCTRVRALASEWELNCAPSRRNAEDLQSPARARF